MSVLNLQALQAAVAFATVTVEVPALGGTLMFRDIAGADRDRIVRFFHEAGEAAATRNWEFKRLVIGLSLCDEAGARVIPDEQIEPVLGRFGGAVIDVMYEAAAKISGMAPASLGDAVKNSGAGQS